MFDTDSCVVAVDCETTGLNPYLGARPFLWQVCDGAGKIQLFRTDNPKEMARFREILADETIQKVGHNLKFDLKMAKTSDPELIVKGKIHDTMIMATLLNENEPSHALAALSAKYLGSDNATDKALNDWFRKNAYQLRKRFGKNWKRYDAVPWEIMKPYASNDVIETIKLAFLYSGPIEEVYSQIYAIEMKFLPALVDIEARGHRVDVPYFKRMRLKARTKIKLMTERLQEAVALEDFNPDSPAQVGKYFNSLEIESPERTKKGNPS